MRPAVLVTNSLSADGLPPERAQRLLDALQLGARDLDVILQEARILRVFLKPLDLAF